MLETTNSRILWLVLLGALSALLSYGLACVMPFAALASVAALNLRPRDAIAATMLGWLANQAIGFTLLDYPTDPMTLAWGIALGLSALAAVLVALSLTRTFDRTKVSMMVLTLGAAVVAQQAVVAMANAVLTSHPDALSLATFILVLKYNVLGFGILLAVQFAGHLLQLTRAPLLVREGL